jgi:hypothetical protein
MKIAMRSLSVLGVLFAASCASSPAPSPETQAIVDSMMQQHPDVVRLSVHAVPPGGGEFRAIASSSSDKRGQKSDPEDLSSMQSGEVIVMDEPGAIDVTVPILMQNGKHTASAGVTIKAAAGTRDAAVAEAKSIANAIATAMTANAAKK